MALLPSCLDLFGARAIHYSKDIGFLSMQPISLAKSQANAEFLEAVASQAERLANLMAKTHLETRRVAMSRRMPADICHRLAILRAGSLGQSPKEPKGVDLDTPATVKMSRGQLRISLPVAPAHFHLGKFLHVRAQNYWSLYPGQ